MRTDILQQAQAIRASMDAAALEPWQAGTSYAKGAAPAIEANKTYEFDVYNGVWAVQEVVSA